MKELTSDKTIKALQKQNRRLQRELEVNIHIAKTLLRYTWLSPDTQELLLDAVSQMSMSDDEAFAKPKRLVFTIRLSNLVNNLQKLSELLPFYLAEYQKNYLLNQNKRHWVSFQWYVRSHHYHTGLKKMTADRDRLWLTSVSGEQGIILRTVQRALKKWLQHPFSPFPFEEVFLDVTSEMKQTLKSIVTPYPIEHLYNDSYETYLLAFYKTLCQFDDDDRLCDRQFCDADMQRWFQQFYVDAYRGTKTQPAKYHEENINQTVKRWRAA